METILLFKKDLDKYPTKSLRRLHAYFNLPFVNNEDLAWAIALHQANNNVRGTMNNDNIRRKLRSKASMKGAVAPKPEWVDIMDVNVFEYDQVLNLLEQIAQLDSTNTEYKLTTATQDPIKNDLLRRHREDLHRLRGRRLRILPPSLQQRPNGGFYELGVEIVYKSKSDGNYRLGVHNRNQMNDWQFVAEFDISSDDLPDENEVSDIQDLVQNIDAFRGAEVITMDPREFVEGPSGLKGHEDVTLSAFTVVKIPKTKVARATMNGQRLNQPSVGVAGPSVEEARRERERRERRAQILRDDLKNNPQSDNDNDDDGLYEQRLNQPAVGVAGYSSRERERRERERRDRARIFMNDLKNNPQSDNDDDDDGLYEQ